MEMRKGEELKTPRHASAAATRDDRLLHSRQLPRHRELASKFNFTAAYSTAAAYSIYMLLSNINN